MPTLSLSAIGLFAVLLGFNNFIANRGEDSESGLTLRDQVTQSKCRALFADPYFVLKLKSAVAVPCVVTVTLACCWPSCSCTATRV